MIFYDKNSNFQTFMAFYDFMTVWEPWFYISTFYMFPCKFCEISMNTFFTKNVRATASESDVMPALIEQLW